MATTQCTTLNEVQQGLTAGCGMSKNTNGKAEQRSAGAKAMDELFANLPSNCVDKTAERAGTTLAIIGPVRAPEPSAPSSQIPAHWINKTEEALRTGKMISIIG